VAVVDLGLPHLSGMQLIQHWRAAGRRFPILILTARGRWQTRWPVWKRRGRLPGQALRAGGVTGPLARSAQARRRLGPLGPPLRAGEAGLSAQRVTVNGKRRGINLL